MVVSHFVIILTTGNETYFFPFHKPAVVQQEAEQAQQDKCHASQYSQQKHSVICADVLREHWTYWKDKRKIEKANSVKDELSQEMCFSHCQLSKQQISFLVIYQ